MRGFIVHEHQPVVTTSREDFGASLARHEIFPLAHLAAVCDLQPVLSPSPGGAVGPSSVHEGLLGLPPPPAEAHLPVVLTLHTWNDPEIGGCGGDARVVAERLQAYLDHHRRQPQQQVVGIRLRGTLAAMEPTPQAYQWLQQRSAAWINAAAFCGDAPATLRITAHVARGGNENVAAGSSNNSNDDSRACVSIRPLLTALDQLRRAGCQVRSCEFNVFTEEPLAAQDEQLLLSSFPNVHIHHRGGNDTNNLNTAAATTLLFQDIRAMALTDVFVPSASYLSALVGYLTHGVIWIHDASLHSYFGTHAQLDECEVVDCSCSSKLHQELPQRRHSCDLPPNSPASPHIDKKARWGF